VASNPWPRAAVFDCDGLLVDSDTHWHRAYRTLCERDEWPSVAAALSGFHGLSAAGAAEKLTRQLARPVSTDDVRRALDTTFAADPPAAMPGVRAVVAALAQEIPLAVASNTPRP